jgi:hypothetical protein
MNFIVLVITTVTVCSYADAYGISQPVSQNPAATTGVKELRAEGLVSELIALARSDLGLTNKCSLLHQVSMAVSKASERTHASSL